LSGAKTVKVERFNQRFNRILLVSKNGGLIT